VIEAPYAHGRIPQYDRDILWLEDSRETLKPAEYKEGMRVSLRAKCLADPYFTCKYLIGYPDLYEPLHRPMIEHVAFTPGEEKLSLYPRGHLKTSVISVGYSTWRLLRDPNFRILITNAIKDNAIKIAWAIQQQFRTNPRMAWLFPEFILANKRYSMERFNLPNKTETFRKEFSLESLSVESDIVSNHFDLAICDDLVSLDCLRSETENQKVKTFYGSLNPIIDYSAKYEGETRFCTIGTRWHQNDLYGDMMDKNSEYYDPDIKVISMGLKYRKGQKRGEYIFPTMWNPEREKKERRRVERLPMGKFLWWSQYYNEARNRSNQRFTKDMFIWKPRSALAEILPYCRKYIIVDPTSSKEAYSDPACIMDVRVSPTSKYYIAGLISKQMTPDELIRMLFKIASREQGFHRDVYKIIFESAGLQKTYLTAIEYFKKGDPDEGRPPQTLPEIIPTVTSTTSSKEDRIDGLEPFYRRGAIQYIEGVDGIETLNTQLLNHRNNPKNDDAMDILASSIPKMSAPFVPGFVEPDTVIEYADVSSMSMNDVREIRRMYAEKNMRPGRFHGHGIPIIGAA